MEILTDTTLQISIGIKYLSPIIGAITGLTSISPMLRQIVGKEWQQRLLAVLADLELRHPR
jgi:hypothetical protein